MRDIMTVKHKLARGPEGLAADLMDIVVDHAPDFGDDRWLTEVRKGFDSVLGPEKPDVILLENDQHIHKGTPEFLRPVE
jgi:hypothetical protein